MTKEERKQRRQERRRLRRERRQQNRGNLKLLKNAGANLPSLPDDATIEEYVAKYNEFWPTVRAGLLLSKKLTGKKMDEKIQQVVDEGDKLANDPNLAENIQNLVDKLRDTWSSVKNVLIIIMNFTGDGVDEIIEKIIDFVDGIMGDDGEDDE